MSLKEDTSEIKFQSKWFEQCLKDFLGIRNREITDKDIQEIKYLFVTTTHSYELGFASVLPPELFQTCAFQDTGDEWYFECIEHTEKYDAAEDILDIEASDLGNDYQVFSLRLKQDIPRFQGVVFPTTHQIAVRKAMQDFDKYVKRYYPKNSDFDGLIKDEVTCDYGILIPEDFAQLTNLEVLRLMSCQTEIHSLKFLKDLHKLRILEIGEVFLDDLVGLEELIGLEKLCIWSN